jgi:hypothetical protein
MRSKFWLESLKAGDQSEGLSVGGRIILKRILGKSDLGKWIRFLRIVTGDALL